MAFKWSHEIIKKLIAYVEENPCVYNVRSAEYLERNKKAEAYNSILKELKEMDTNITLQDIKRKWKVLGTQFMKEVRSIEQSKKSGCGVDDVYIPKLWCFEQLRFLTAYSKMRASKDNTKEDNIQTEEPTVPKTAEEDCSFGETSKKRFKNSGAFTVINKRLDEFKAIVAEKRSKKTFAWLGNLVAEQMERISPEDQDDAAWQVQCLMRKLIKESAERNHASSSSSSAKNIIELSMEGVFDDDDFAEII